MTRLILKVIYFAAGAHFKKKIFLHIVTICIIVIPAHHPLQSATKKKATLSEKEIIAWMKDFHC